MSQLTFNIADYRPITGTQIRTVQTPRKTSGFIVMSPASDIRSYAEPAVVDIRRVRDAQRFHRSASSCGVYQRRAKVLRFAGSESGSSETLSVREMSDESGPSDLPPAA
jgi:hypothetical protein